MSFHSIQQTSLSALCKEGAELGALSLIQFSGCGAGTDVEGKMGPTWPSILPSSSSSSSLLVFRTVTLDRGGPSCVRAEEDSASSWISKRTRLRAPKKLRNTTHQMVVAVIGLRVEEGLGSHSTSSAGSCCENCAVTS